MVVAGCALVRTWLPALEAAERRLRRGARVAEIGVGASSRVVELALAYPSSTFHGFDADPAAVAQVRDAVAMAGVSDRVTYEILRSGAGGVDYDVVRARATAASRNAARARGGSVLAPGGVWIVTGATGATIDVRP
jgi:precorrin-6B methylase 2